MPLSKIHSNFEATSKIDLRDPRILEILENIPSALGPSAKVKVTSTPHWVRIICLSHPQAFQHQAKFSLQIFLLTCEGWRGEIKKPPDQSAISQKETVFWGRFHSLISGSLTSERVSLIF